MSMTLSDLRGTPHTSISQLKTFLFCPRRYRYQYVDRVEPSFRSIALALGTAFHHAVGAHLLPPAAGEPLSRDALHTLFRDSLVQQVESDPVPVLFDDDEDLGQTVDLGLAMLDTFTMRVALPDEVLGVEVPFVLELAHPITGEAALLPLVGAIDAVVVEDGETFVWELKTGKKKWRSDQIEFDAQPTAYVMAARELGYGEVNAKLLVTTKAKKPDVQVERLVRRAGDERELAESVLAVLRAVEAGVDHRARGWQCRSCAYAGTCAA